VACGQLIDGQQGHAQVYQGREGCAPGFAMLKVPILSCPNDPDEANLLSDVDSTQIDEA
jgi:hypothetical protein